MINGSEKKNKMSEIEIRNTKNMRNKKYMQFVVQWELMIYFQLNIKSNSIFVLIGVLNLSKIYK